MSCHRDICNDSIVILAINESTVANYFWDTVTKADISTSYLLLGSSLFSFRLVSLTFSFFLFLYSSSICHSDVHKTHKYYIFYLVSTHKSLHETPRTRKKHTIHFSLVLTLLAHNLQNG